MTDAAVARQAELAQRPLGAAADRDRGARCEPFEATSLRPEGWAEQSGTIVHGTLATLGIAPETVLWNVVPAHPHRPGNPLSNRTPAIGELRAGAEVLGDLIERLQPRATIAVGRSAERALGELGLPCHGSVRHPANGGATAFRRGLAELTP